MSYEKITLNPIAGAMGVEIEGVDLSQPLDNKTFDEIHQAFLENLVIIFHDQNLTPEQCKSFAQRFGPLDIYPFVKGLDEHPEIFEIRKEPDEQRNFGGKWHSDMSFTARPPVGTMLYAKEGVTQSELADFMELEKATLGRLLDRLEEKEWVERRPDTLDRRVNRLYLTDKVQEVMRALRNTAAEVRKDALGDLGDMERERFIDTLLKIKTNLLSLDDSRPEIPAREALVAAADD